jgi:phosphatidate cytidylyltransferase
MRWLWRASILYDTRVEGGASVAARHAIAAMTKGWLEVMRGRGVQWRQSNAMRIVGPRNRLSCDVHARSDEARCYVGHRLAPQERVDSRESLEVREPVRGSDLGKRVAVAALGIPIVAWIVAGDRKASAALIAAAAVIGCWEYYRLVFGVMPSSGWVGLLAAALLPLIPAFVAPDRAGLLLFGGLGATSMLTWTLELFGGRRADAPERAGHVLGGLLFCSVGLVALSALRAGRDGAAWTAVVLVSAWANDAAAYVVGRAVGKARLWAAVSPGKTWEGLFGGLAGSILALLLIRPLLPRDLTGGVCIAIGVVAGLLGPLGDLCKSMLKRAYHVKDTGHLLPGHGGILDRIDSVLFIAPAVWLFRLLQRR